MSDFWEIHDTNYAICVWQSATHVDLRLTVMRRVGYNQSRTDLVMLQPRIAARPQELQNGGESH